MVFALRVTVSPDRIDAAPGDSLNVSVTVRNTSDIVEHYVVEMLGLPPGSEARCEPEVTKLRPGETGTASLRLTLQQDPPTPAGYYILGALVHSRYREDVSRCEELPLTVRPEERVAVRVAPEIATGGRSARYAVEIANSGNTPVQLRLNATDPERRVNSSFQPSYVDLPPGTAAQAVLDVSAPVPWSKEKQRQLKIEALGAGIAGTGSATFVQRPRFASKLTRVAGMLGAVLVLAAAVLGAALIVRRATDTSAAPSPAASGGANGGAGQPSPTVAPSASPTAQPSPSAPAASATSAAPPAGPQEVNLVGPPAPESGPLASDAFRDKGVLLSGAPAPDGPPQCAEAKGVVVDNTGPGAPFITAALPDDPTACTFVPVQIRFVAPVAAVEVTLGGQGNRRLEAVHRDLSRTIANDLTAADDGTHGGIDFVIIRGLPPDLAAEPVAAAVKSIRFTAMSG
jgi:hypothetical protein